MRPSFMRSVLFKLSSVLFASTLASPALHAQTANAMLGDWQEPGGSAVHIAPCSAGHDDVVCLTLRAVSRDAGTTVDVENPDAAQRTRPLCGLMIGRNFHLKDATHAEEGSLYDPRSGKTYTGSLTVEGDKLKLRGYVGVKLFGRSETWTRARPGSFQPCHS